MVPELMIVVISAFALLVIELDIVPEFVNVVIVELLVFLIALGEVDDIVPEFVIEPIVPPSLRIAPAPLVAEIVPELIIVVIVAPDQFSIVFRSAVIVPEFSKVVIIP